MAGQQGPGVLLFARYEGNGHDLRSLSAFEGLDGFVQLEKYQTHTVTIHETVSPSTQNRLVLKDDTFC